MSNTQTLEKAKKEEAAKKAPTLPRNPDRAMQEMMRIIDDLRAHMQQETAALKNTDTQAFMDLQDNKISTSRRYLDAMQDAMSRGDELKKASPELKAKLEAMREEFAEETKENLAALDRMSKGMRGLETRIMETARREAQKENQFAYGASGQLNDGLKSTIGVNERA